MALDAEPLSAHRDEQGWSPWIARWPDLKFKLRPEYLTAVVPDGRARRKEGRQKDHAKKARVVACRRGDETGLEIHPANDEHGTTVIADVKCGDTEPRPRCIANSKLIAAAWDLRKTLAAQTEAAQSVIDSWAQGRLNTGVREIDATIAPARYKLARANGQLSE